MKRVAVLIADGCEEIEAVTPIDLLRRAGVGVDIVGVTGARVTGSHGITFDADVEISAYRTVPDGVILPGGMPGAQNIADSARAVSLIRVVDEAGGLVAAICAAPAVVLAANQLLTGRLATCYPGFEKQFDDSIEFACERVVVDGNRITSQGPGTAAEFSAAIIRYLIDDTAAKAVTQATLQP